MLRVEIFPEHEQIETRTIPGKDDKPSITIYEQIGYAHLGGKFPVEMKISLEKDESIYKSLIFLE